MKPYIACVLVCLALELTGSAGLKWEVLNDVNTDHHDDEEATQYQILTREQLMPYGKVMFKPKVWAIKQGRNTQKIGEKPAPETNGKQTKTIHPANPRGEHPLEREEVSPLGLPKAGQRHLLQVFPSQLPSLLPQDVEARRLVDKFKLENLSTPCKDAVDEDCLFDIDDLTREVIQMHELTDIEDAGPLSRHKRQGNSPNNNPKDEDEDEEEEGSAVYSSSEEIYKSVENERGGGYYKLKSTLVFDPPDDFNFTTQALEEWRRTFENKSNAVLQAFPGFEGFTSEICREKNKKIVCDFELVIDGAAAAAAAHLAGNNDLEDFILGQLNSSAIPDLNRLNINGGTVSDDDRLDSVFVDKLRDILSDYCGAENACANLGPEFDKKTCHNSGFMSGACTHKCQNYPCQNNATCELDKKFKPLCNCGKTYTGEFCEKTKKEKKGFTTAETVGLGVAGTIVVFCSCCCFLACIFRRKSIHVKYTYYEDEGTEEAASDPTQFSFFIDRPVITASPISVFHPSSSASTSASASSSSNS